MNCWAMVVETTFKSIYDKECEYEGILYTYLRIYYNTTLSDCMGQKKQLSLKWDAAGK